MPHGCSGAIPVVVETIANFKPGNKFSVLDVGCGRGATVAAIIGYNAENIHHTVGLEGFPAHGKPLGADRDVSIWPAYDEVRICDIREEIPRLAETLQQPYSVGLFLEVLEHLTKPDGAELLKYLPKVAKHWLLSTPDRFFEVSWSGDFHEHISQWEPEELKELGWKIIHPRHGTWSEHGWPMWMAYYGDWDLSIVQCIRVEE